MCSLEALARSLMVPRRSSIQVADNASSYAHIQNLVESSPAEVWEPTSGALSICVFNPTEVLKTQMQTAADATTMRAVAARVHAEGGVLAFWSGLQPNVARTFLVNAAELGTYDEAKSRLAPVVGDNALAHIGASGIAGVASACTSTPADVVKTRLMNVAGGAGDRQYAGVVDALRTIVRDEGVGALYKGFTPIVVRKVLWCSMFFVTYEQLRAALVAG